jgi:putative two-component system response regulator
LRHGRESGDSISGRPEAPAGAVSCLARAGRFRDEETAEHVERMSRTSALIARALWFDARERANLRIASAMHDIGKIGVPDAVFAEAGRAERRGARDHRTPSRDRDQILAGSRDPTMRLAATIALTHHERVDGRGHPRRLCGDRIPLAGRIAAVADASPWRDASV